MGKIESLSVLVLAAGEGKRLKYFEGKTMIPIAGRRLIDFPVSESLKALEGLSSTQITVIVGHEKEKLTDHLNHKYKDSKCKITFAHQKKPLGTGDAVKAYFSDINNHNNFEYTLVMCGDAPLIRSEHLKNLISGRDSFPDVVVATFEAKNPFGYGRIIKESERKLKIVEEKDATDAQKKVTEVNSGLYLFKTSFLKEFVFKLSPNNKAGEYYLTDLVDFSDNIEVEKFPEEGVFMGINDRTQHEELQKILYLEKTRKLAGSGVYFIDSSTNYIDFDVEIGEGTTIFPGVTISGHSKIGERCQIENGSIIKNSQLGNEVQVNAYSYIEKSVVEKASSIGPFARLRPDSLIEEECKIGNFVETKKVHFKKGVKVSHLSYVGDAEIGSESNIGCGFITCNYDGAKKHKTVIGEKTFIGSDCQAVAPISIGDNAFVAAGTTITQSVESGAFAIGRSRQVNKDGMAKKFLKIKK